MKIGFDAIKNLYDHVKEVFVPNFMEVGFSGFLSVSFAVVTPESVHAFFVILATVAGGVILHILRYYLQKWLPIEKDKK